jgi:hypothetical protein
LSALESLLAALQSVSASLAIALAAWGFGRLSLRRLHLGDASALSEFVWSEVIGLIIGASGLLGLALLGALHELTVAALTLGGLLCAALEGACILAGTRWDAASTEIGRAAACPRVGRATITLTAALAGLVFVIGAIAALAPPASHQVLASSLEVPKNLLLNHGFGNPLTEQAGPNLAQMWSLWALTLDGPVAANLLHVQLAALLAAAIVLLARPLLGRADAWFAGCLALLCPGVQQQLGLPLEAIPLALVVAMAASAVQAGWQFDVGRPAVPAGVMLGAAVAIDPSGLVFAMTLVACCWFAGQLRSMGRGVAARFSWQTSLTAALVALPWLWVRSASATNGEKLQLADLLTQLGPVLAIALGGLVFARRLHGLNRVFMLLLAYAALVICLPLGPVAWAPLVPLACVAAAWGWCEVQRLPRLVRGSVAVLAFMLATWDAVALLSSCTPRLAVACGWQPREAFLLDHSGSYRAATILNQICCDGQRLLSQDAENLYFSCPTTLATVPADAPGSGVPQEVTRRLIARGHREGYAYLLLAEPVVNGRAQWAPSPDSVLAAIHQDDLGGEILNSNGEVIPILEYCYADDNNRYVRYRLLKLQGPQAVPERVLPLVESRESDAVGTLPRLPTR